jgi:hypothetical protein
VVKATYTESIRKYTIKYVNRVNLKEEILQQSESEYGTYVPYVGETPRYNGIEGEESAWTYYLFNTWD